MIYLIQTTFLFGVTKKLICFADLKNLVFLFAHIVPIIVDNSAKASKKYCRLCSNVT